MRRVDKEIINNKEINKIINTSNYCNLAIAKNNIPYCVPMNFGYHNRYIYLHSAPKGFKIDILKENPQVCIVIVRDAQLVKAENKCISSMKFNSVIITGKADFLWKEKERKEALGHIVKHYYKDFQNDDSIFAGSAPDELAIIRVTIEKISGKKSR